jgi:hypothetical protein
MSDDAPPAPPAIRTLGDLHVHLQAAVELEHSTIPPYLTALYSIRDPTRTPAAAIIGSVVLEEMLHMVLAANVLNAVGGAPSINDPRFVPSYPAMLPIGRDRPIEVNICRFSPEAIATFLAIEYPKRPSIAATAAKTALLSVARSPDALLAALRRGDLYASIGDFYEAIEQGLRALEANAKARNTTIFTGDHARQVRGDWYYGGGGQVVVVKDLDTALAALAQIVYQGEGYGDTIDDGDDVVSAGQQFKEVAHYYRFNEIAEGKRYKQGDKADDPPSGDPLPVDYSAAAVWPMIDNPAPEKYTDPALIQMSNNFSAMYTRLLGTLHSAFNGEPEAMEGATVAMMDLKGMARDLMANPIAGQAGNAGPCFRYLDQMFA